MVPVAVLVVVIAEASVLTTVQVRLPATEPAALEPLTARFEPAVTLPVVKFDTVSWPVELRPRVRTEEFNGDEFVIVPERATDVFTSARLPVPVVIVNVAA
jgi:hypothetical protein